MAVRHYVLVSTDGFIDVATQTTVCNDRRRQIYVWGFVGGLLEVDGKVVPENAHLDYRKPRNWPKIRALQGTATIPSPIVYAEQGDKLYITLINVGFEQIPTNIQPHTIHMHGAQVATTQDGFPETSVGVPPWVPNPNTGKFNKPDIITYFFDTTKPGTYMYHCHVGADHHIQMGMYGALFIYPSRKSLAKAGITQDKRTKKWCFKGVPQDQIPITATNRNFAYNDIHTYFDKEYVFFLSDIDYTWHQNTLYGDPFNAVNYKPIYWLLNGRTFPDTLLPAPKQPGSDVTYDSYVHVSAGQRFLLRFSNLAYDVNPFHIHGFHYLVAGEDSELSPFLKIASKMGDTSDNLAQRGFTISVAAGQTRDIIVPTEDQRDPYRTYQVDGLDGFPPQCSQIDYLEYYSRITGLPSIADIPTEPVNCPNPNTTTSLEICNQPPNDPNNQFFPQFFPMHNHNDYQNTNNGLYPGGQVAYYQVDPPDTYMEVPKCVANYRLRYEVNKKAKKKAEHYCWK